MATDVYRAPELRHRVGERHFSILDGVRAAATLTSHWKGRDQGCGTGLSCSLSPKPQPG